MHYLIYIGNAPHVIIILITRAPGGQRHRLDLDYERQGEKCNLKNFWGRGNFFEGKVLEIIFLEEIFELFFKREEKVCLYLAEALNKKLIMKIKEFINQKINKCFNNLYKKLSKKKRKEK